MLAQQIHVQTVELVKFQETVSSVYVHHNTQERTVKFVSYISLLLN